MAIQSYEQLLVWQRAVRLAAEITALTRKLPQREEFALSSQLRRAAVSIASNIAEGSTRPTRAYMHHLRIALGSEAEIKTQLKLAVEMRYLTPSDIEPVFDMASEVGRMLNGLIRSLRNHLPDS